VATTDLPARRFRGSIRLSGPEVVDLGSGDHIDLRVAAVAERIGDATVRMLGRQASP
jgi:hypothetical protein